MTRTFLLFIALSAAGAALGQETAVPIEGMSDAQRVDYRMLLRNYRETFRVLGRSRVCGLDFEAERFFREVARRHGEDSEALRIARRAYQATAENVLLGQDIDPTPPAPMPCDVVQYMRDMRLPELPASLVRPRAVP